MNLSCRRSVTENATIRSGDSVIFFNFRPDRARELTRALVDPDFAGFRRKKRLLPAGVYLHDPVRRHHAQCGGGL